MESQRFQSVNRGKEQYEAVLEQKDLGIANRLRRTKAGPVGRGVSPVASLQNEEMELTRGSTQAEGSPLNGHAKSSSARRATKRSDAAVITEVVALRMLMSTVLRSIALRETMTPETFAQILAEVRSGKHDATRDVLNQYQTVTKEP